MWYLIAIGITFHALMQYWFWWWLPLIFLISIPIIIILGVICKKNNQTDCLECCYFQECCYCPYLDASENMM